MKKLLLLILLFIYIISVSCQNFDIHQTLFSSKDGMIGSRVNCLMEDSTGFIWIGTDNGISRYNSHDFVNYMYQPGSKKGLHIKNIKGFFLDENDDVWCFGEGLAKYNREDDSFTHFFYDKNDTTSLLNNGIYAIALGSDDQLYIGTWGGISKLNRKTGKFTNLTFSINPYESTITAIYIDSHKKIWCGSYAGMCYVLDTNLNVIKKYNSKELGIEKHKRHFKNISQFVESENGKMFIYGFFIDEIKFSVFDPKKNKWLSYDDFIIKDGFPTDFITFHKKIGKNQYLLSDIHGNYLMDLDKMTIEKSDILSNIEQPYTVRLIDSKGGYWKINNQKKLSYQHPDNNIFQFIKFKTQTVELNREQHIINKLINDIYLLKSNSDYIIYNSNTHAINPELKGTAKFRFNNYMNQVSKIIPYKPEIDLYFIDKQIFLQNNITGQKNVLYTHNANISDIKLDPDNNIWFLSDNVLFKYNNNGSATIFKDPTGKAEQYFHEFIAAFYFEPDGTLWLQDYFHRLFRFNKGLHEYEVFSTLKNDKDAISEAFITRFHFVKDDKLWMSSDLAIVTYDKRTKKFEEIKELNGFYLTDLSGLLVEKDELWMAGKRGMQVFNLKDSTLRFFKEENGLQGSIFTTEFKLLENGNVIIGGLNGLNIFNPGKIKMDTSENKIVFTKLLINGNEIFPNSNDVLLHPIYKTKKITINHQQNKFQIYFSALNNKIPGNTTYAYKLEGFDHTYQQVQYPENSAKYTNLKAGDYQLKVKSTNSSSVWSKNTTILHIKILPPWWETWIFRVSMLIFIVLMLYLAWQSRIKTLQKRQLILEKQVQERTAEIETQKEELKENNLLLKDQRDEIIAQSEELRATMDELHVTNSELQRVNATKDKFFSIIAHDLKNPFYAISGFASLLNTNYSDFDDNKKRECIAMIETASKGAANLLENLLTWSRSQTNRLNFNPQSVNVKTVIEETIALLEVNAHNKGISIKMEIDKSAIVFADQNMLTTIIRNLMNNAIKFTEKGGQIIFSTAISSNEVIIKIADSGVGMSKETSEKLFKIDSHISTSGTGGESGTGLGLIICREFIEKNNGYITVESEVGKGSIFMIHLPRSD